MKLSLSKTRRRTGGADIWPLSFSTSARDRGKLSTSHISPGIGQIPAELIKEGGRTIRYQIHKLIVSIWNKEELPVEQKESIIVPIHKKGDKTDCNNYRAIPLLPTTYKILSHILLSRLTTYAEEIIGDHQCGFRGNRSTTDHLFCIHQMLEKKWE